MNYILASALVLNSVSSVQLTHPSDLWFNPDFRLNNGKRPIQLAPHSGIVPDRRSVDVYPQGDHQLYKPIILEDQVDNDDVMNYYNPNPSWHHADYVQTKDDLSDALKSIQDESDSPTFAQKQKFVYHPMSAAELKEYN